MMTHLIKANKDVKSEDERNKMAPLVLYLEDLHFSLCNLQFSLHVNDFSCFIGFLSLLDFFLL